MEIKFIGAAREVTGSKHLITTRHGKKILLDCGMFQGKGLETDSLNRNTMVDPAEIDHIILTHAHVDHSGLIPYFYKRGFRGSVICTAATRNLCSIMLPDSGFIQENDTIWFNKKRARQGLKPVDPIYTEKEARECLDLFISVPLNRQFHIDNNIKVKFSNTGHLLGSAAATIEIDEFGEVTRIGYTGDIGRNNNYLLRAPDAFPQCDYLIVESTYGDRLHQNKQLSEDELLRIIKHTCVEKKGKLIIPSFAIGRTQEIVYVLNKLYNDGRLERVPVYVDSPLSANATEIFRRYADTLNEEVRDTMRFDPDPFGFNTLRYITDVQQSKALNRSEQPCIVISSSGMLEAGRIKHHVSNHIDDPTTTILIVGYCTPTSLGARIQDPTLRFVSIFGYDHRIRAQVTKIEGFSGHGDYHEMIQYFSACQDVKQIQRTFIVHGDAQAQGAFKDHLYEAGFRHITIPQKGESVVI